MGVSFHHFFSRCSPVTFRV